MNTSISLARIYINGKPYEEDAPWAIQKKKANMLKSYGYRVEVHSPRYPGMDYCKNCGKQAIKPPLLVYDRKEYWKCTCKQIDWVNYK